MQLSHLLPKKLKRRIIVLFFTFTLLFSILISFSFFILAKRAEQQLQVIDMGLAIERIRAQYLNGEQVGRHNRFFHGPAYSATFPSWLQNLSAGFYKIDRDHLIWHVMIVDYPDQRYILLRDYTAFESSRLHPIWLSLFVLMSSAVLSLILVWISLVFVIYPIEKLETNIRLRGLTDHQQPMSAQYNDDEIGQLAQAFDQLYDKLNQALQRERLFTADVSHELRTPLMVILSSSELLCTSTNLTDKQLRRLLNIQTAAEQILQRLEVYLALARQNTQAINHFKSKPIYEIAQAVIMENEAFASRYLVSLNLIDEACMTQYPADFCHTILSNLVRNAIEYAGSNSKVTIHIYSTGFAVTDNGVGISAKLQNQIFEAFTGTNSDSSQHLGLGLSLVKRICDYLDWQIQFLSTPNQGSQFIIDTQPTEYSLSEKTGLIQDR